ncbi:MAG: DUF368 domain-containing protein [Fibrobacter sp.]|nr:DUF368 domain-containing protein [Fibrobacter sp.]
MNLLDIFRGMIIGVANIIPGVSGGTLALVLGIFERLIGAIHKISFQTISASIGLLRFNKKGWNDFTAELKRIDAYFLASILIGAMISIGALAKLMTYFLEHFHDPTYGFFWGLVLVSAWVPFKLIKKHTFFSVLAAVIAIAGVIILSSSVSDEEKINREQTKYEIETQKTQISDTFVKGKTMQKPPSHYLFMVFAGAIGISAMILPGISGSFLLLLMGAYFTILKAITELDILTLGAVSIGCLIGILACSRLITYALKRWYDVTTSFLLGLVFGSLVAIWPFKGIATVGEKTVYLSNVLPSSFGLNEMFTILAALVGGIIVWIFIKIEKKGNIGA